MITLERCKFGVHDRVAVLSAHQSLDIPFIIGVIHEIVYALHRYKSVKALAGVMISNEATKGSRNSHSAHAHSDHHHSKGMHDEISGGSASARHPDPSLQFGSKRSPSFRSFLNGSPVRYMCDELKC
jgi:hypothetical protein